jgi:type II secretory ATPase GspE/PulE/Tfp pilus assembly ATPase PilB-like protein
VELVMAQRLVRVICKHCKEEIPESENAANRAEFGDLVPPKLYRGKGCRACLNTGFRGRRGIFEMMPLSEEIRQMIMERASSGRMRRIALDQGMNSLRMDGWRLVREGVTTIQEVVFATKDEANMSAAMAGLDNVVPKVGLLEKPVTVAGG